VAARGSATPLPRPTVWLLGGLATAVAVVAIVPRGGHDQRAPVPASRVATVVATLGTLSITGRDGVQRFVNDAGGALFEGDTLESDGRARAVVVFTGGTTLKIDRDSATSFITGGELSLDRGAIYLDTGLRRVGEPEIAVRTSAGVVRHIGTQFDVRTQADVVVVRVREGSIIVDRTAARLVAHAGEAVHLRSNGTTDRRLIATHGADWAWVSHLVMPFTLEGATLESFLDWAAREQGWSWEFENPAVWKSVAGTVLHGAIEGLSVTEALDAVLPACGITFRREGHRLILRK
jgi:ferric-dicitrate binding protein FerR (iron transport regulator)